MNLSMLYKLADAVKGMSPEVETLSFTLHSTWMAASESFLEAFDKFKLFEVDLLEGKVTYNAALYSSIRNIEVSKLTYELGTQLTTPVEDILGLAYASGVAETGIAMTAGLVDKLRDDLSANRLALQVVGYATAYFERFVDPLIYKAFGMIDAGEVSPTTFKNIYAGIIHKIKSDNYWKILGSVFASRAFNFAILDVGYYSGYKQYEIVNPREGFTGSVCDWIIGRTFPIDKAIAIAYSLETSAPGGDKLIYPWPAGKDIIEAEKLTDEQFIDLGLIIPPFHPHCKSQIALLA